MPSYFRVMPRELCPLKLSGIGSVVRQSNEVSSAAGGMSGCRSHQLHRHLVNSSAITVNKSCSLLIFLWHPSPRDAGLCTEALWGMWGCVCVCEDFGAETGFAQDPTNKSEVVTEHSLPVLQHKWDGTVRASGKRLYMDNMLEIRLEMWVKKTP